VEKDGKWGSLHAYCEATAVNLPQPLKKLEKNGGHCLLIEREAFLAKNLARTAT
jgi:hypothetical protein